MNNQQTKVKKKTKKSYPLFTYFCLLLAVATMCMGATFAKYASSTQNDVGVGVVPLVCSFSLDEISSTTFSNSNYWLNIHGEPQAQNHPREIIFSVHNYEKNADGTKSAPSELDLQSTFRFYAPQEFLGNIAFQILKRGDGNTRIPLTQQYVLPTIIEKACGNTSEIYTSDFVDYGEYTGREDEKLTLTNQGFDATKGDGKIVAIAQTQTENVQVATIALTAEKHHNINYEITQVRGNETKVDDGNGNSHFVNDMSAPEYYSIHQATEMVYYCLDVTLPSMTMQAKKNADGIFQEVDDQYIFAFTIIESKEFNAETDPKVKERFNVKGVSLYSDSACQTFSKSAVIKVVNSLNTSKEITSSEYYLVENTTETKFELNGNAVTINGTTYYVDKYTQDYLKNYRWNPSAEKKPESEADLPYKIDAVVEKVFPTDVRVLFTQASQIGGD